MLGKSRTYPDVGAAVILAAFLTAGAGGPPAAAQVEVAGDLFVELDAGHETAGTEVWRNTASETIGDFNEVGDPVKEEVAGMPAVTFNTTDLQDAYQSPAAPPAGLVGLDPTRSIEVWAYNPEVALEETLVAWGRRGGPDGTNMSFNYGTSGLFGAVGHWGKAGPDLGWSDGGGAPAAGWWHHLVYTYDGQTTRVYVDGCLAGELNCEKNLEYLGFGVVDTPPEPLITLAAQIERDGFTLNYNWRGTLSIGRIRIHDGVLTPAQIQNNYDIECLEFCPQPGLPECEICPVDGDSLYKGKGTYIRLLRFTGFPQPTSLGLVEPPGATLTDDGSGFSGPFTYAYDLPDPEPASFIASVRCTNDEGTATFSWEVTLIDPPDRGDIEVAGDLFVELDASHESAGAGVWLNSGALADFGKIGEPVRAMLGPRNSPAVKFNDGVTSDSYQCFENAPPGLVGLDPTRSIEVWAFNPDIGGEETLIAWGRREGPCGTNMSFNYGTDQYSGAVVHWCHLPGPDMGWDDAGGAPRAGEWHHLVYTYDGDTTRVYADGVLANSEVLGAGAINTWPDHPITLAVQIADAAGALDLGSREGSLALGQIRIHDEALTPEQIRTNFDLEREVYGVGEIPPEPPVFLDAPADDRMLSGDGIYTRTLTVSGFPVPLLEVLEPTAGATITQEGVFSYNLPDPEPDSFDVRVTAANDSGSDEASWTVTIVKPKPLAAFPLHRYSFSGNADDSIGPAHGAPLGGITFQGGAAALPNDGSQNSNASGRSPPADPPGGYIDLPNGVISALGNQATFEAWVTWDGPVGSSWQRILDFGTSAGGEDWSDGAGGQHYIFLTPRSAADTLRFGYRAGGVERFIEGARLPDGSEQHVVVVWDGENTTATMYLNGRQVAQDMATHFALSDIPDVNNWLGRSQWPDAMFDGSYNEFRIYGRALTENEVLGNFVAGPDVVNFQGTLFVRGDADANGQINITDVIVILGYLYKGEAVPPCLDAADVDDVSVNNPNLTDAIFLLGWLFRGMPPPAAPTPTAVDYSWEDCGPDVRNDFVDCDSFPPCE